MGNQQTRVAPRGSESALPNLHYRWIERAIGSNFTAVLIDCEGCLVHVWETGIFSQLRLVMLEEDGRPKYVRDWHPRLRQAGFVRVYYARDRVAGWGNHSAWVRAASLAEARASGS